MCEVSDGRVEIVDAILCMYVCVREVLDPQRGERLYVCMDLLRLQLSGALRCVCACVSVHVYVCLSVCMYAYLRCDLLSSVRGMSSLKSQCWMCVRVSPAQKVKCWVCECEYGCECAYECECECELV